MTTGLQGWLMAGAGAATAGAVTVGALLLWPAPTPRPVGSGAPVVAAPEAGKPSAPVEAAASKADPAAKPEPAASPEASARPEVAAPDPVAAAPSPRFDHVRIEADGSAVIAGRAAPRAKVQLLIDAALLAETMAGPDGQFALLTSLPLSDQPKQLELVAEVAGQRQSAMLMVEPIASAAPETASAEAAGAVVEAGAAVASAEEASPETKVAETASEAAPGAAGADTVPAAAVAEASAPAGEAGAPVDVARSEPMVVAGAAAGEGASPVPEASASAAVAAPLAASSGPLTAPLAGEGAEPALAAGQQVAAAIPTATALPSSDGAAPDAAVPAADPLPKVVLGRVDGAGAPDHPAEDDQIAAAAEAQPQAATLAPAAPRVVVADEAGVRVLQSGEAPEVQSARVALDTISYAPDGAVILAGRGAADRFIRVYVDNSEIITAAIGADGQWQTDLPQVDKGVYTLRVDELDASGAVTSRTETPFLREDATSVAAEMAAAGAKPDQPVSVVVQPGNTLWGLARTTYGKGTLYVRVFEANRSRIRNPDLIYPGQVFDLPEVVR